MLLTRHGPLPDNREAATLLVGAGFGLLASRLAARIRPDVEIGEGSTALVVGGLAFFFAFDAAWLYDWPVWAGALVAWASWEVLRPRVRPTGRLPDRGPAEPAGRSSRRLSATGLIPPRSAPQKAAGNSVESQPWASRDDPRRESFGSRGESPGAGRYAPAESIPRWPRRELGRIGRPWDAQRAALLVAVRGECGRAGSGSRHHAGLFLALGLRGLCVAPSAARDALPAASGNLAAASLAGSIAGQKEIHSMEILLPRTDAGALGQVAVVTAVLIVALVVARRSAEARLLVLGVGLVALGWMALRTLH